MIFVGTWNNMYHYVFLDNKRIWNKKYKYLHTHQYILLNMLCMILMTKYYLGYKINNFHFTCHFQNQSAKLSSFTFVLE